MTAIMPLISVIIPVYNGERTIKETVKSVLDQSFTDLEIILINDGSQDGTLEVVYSIKDSRLKVFSFENAGVAVSRNRGVERACGEYIAFLDADDLWTQDKLAAQLTALQHNPQAAVAYSLVDYIDEMGDFLHHGHRIKINGNAYQQMLVENLLENGSNPLIRREAIIEVGGFDGSLTPAEDWDMWLRLAAGYEFVAVPCPQILYRTLSRSGSTNVLKMETAGVQLIEKAFNRAPVSLQHLRKRAYATFYRYLSTKSIESEYQRKNIVTALKFLYLSISYDISVWQWNSFFKTLGKILSILVLSPRQYQKCKHIFKKISVNNFHQLQRNF